jgi:putative spermidine/putrescine transport system ATP-binding protein
MSFLQLTGVTKYYGTTCAVSAMNLSVEKGEFVSLLGPSGCGKTTTLQMVAGFEAVSSGRIELDGQDITTAKANTRGLGIVFQTYALFPHMTVADNVSFGLEMRKMPRSNARNASRRRWRWCTSRCMRRSTRASCRAASASASPWPAPW